MEDFAVTLSGTIADMTARAANKWFEKWSRTHEQTIAHKLSDAADEIIYRALGFKKGSWGNDWEIDGSSKGDITPIGKCINERATSAVNLFIKKLEERMSSFAVTDEMLAAGKKKFTDDYNRYIQQNVYKAASRMADKHIAEMAERVGSGLQMELPDVVKVTDAEERLSD